MKKVIIIIAIAICSITILYSCYGEINETSGNTSILSFGQYIKDMSIMKAKGTILLQSNEFEISQELENNIDISVREGASDLLKIYDTNGTIVNVSELNNSIEKKRGLFGNYLGYNIKNSQNNNKMYIPKLLKIYYSDKTIKNGSILKWNTDTDNKKGIIIWLSYTPLDQGDMSIISNNRKVITHGLTTEDDGSYTITENDLERFPKNSVLSINIARTNYIINSDETPSLIAFTTVCKNVGYSN